MMIEEQVIAFENWRVSQDGIRLIASLQKKANAVQDAVLDSLFHKVPSLDERERKVVQKHFASVVNQLLREPIASVKEYSQMEDGKKQLDIVARAFGLDTEVELQSQTNHRTSNYSSSSPSERQDQVRVIGTLSTI
jgi:glutamyl-tRNA reductase